MKRVLVFFGSLVLMLIAIVGPAAAEPDAQPRQRTVEVGAMAAPPGCTPTNVCFWVHINYVDGPGRLAGTNPDWRRFGHSTCQTGTWDNCASSVYNHGTSCWSVLWDGYSYTLGATGNLSMARDVGISDLTAWAFNDVISSNSWTNCG